MYLIKSGNMIIYDSTDKDTYPVLSPSFDEELNGSGTLTFTILPNHPYYNQMKEMQTFITAYRDNDEIFYGRILTTDVQIDGQMEVSCEGGMTFFMDTEIGKGKYNETCEAFLTRILNNHNSMIDTARQFTLGTVNVAKAIEYDEEIHSVKKFEFEIKGFATTKSVMESLILGQFGGFFRIRSDGNGGHILDYLENYGRINTQPVQLGHNIVDKTHRISGEGMFTLLRPLWGQNKTIENLTQADVLLPNVTKNGEWLILDNLVSEYGNIYHTESFDDDKLVTSAIKCLRKAEEFITRHGTQLPASVDIGFVDFYHLNKKNVLNITPTNHNAWSFYGIPNVLLPNTKYTFSINGSPGYSYSLWLSTSSNTTRMLADEIGARTSVIFTTPETMSEEFLVISGSASGAGNESLDVILPQVIKTVDDIRLGDVFTTIEDFQGVTLTVGNIHLDMENPGNDTMTLKNDEELYGEGVTSNSLTVIESKYQITDAFRYHYIKEELETGLSIFGPKLAITTRVLDALTNKTYLAVSPKQDDPTSGEMVLQALKYGQTPTDPDAPYQPTVQLTLGGVKLSASGQMVDEATGESFTTTAALQVQAERITAAVTRIDDLEDTTNTITGSQLWLKHDEIAALNGKFEVDPDTGDVIVKDGAGLYVQRGTSNFGVFDNGSLTAGVIVNRINGGTVNINASKINLNGQTVADVINANSASITDITSNGLANVNYIIATTGSFGSLSVANESVEWHTLNWNMGMDSTSVIAYKNIRLGHYHTFRVTEDSGVVSLTLGAPTTDDPGTQTFNIADTAFYQQAVSAATATGEATGAASLAGNWSSNLFFAETSTSTQSPASQIIAEFDLPTTISSSTLHSGSQTAIDITVTATTSSTPGGSGSPVNFPITVDATPAYNAGVDSVNLSESWNGATYTVSTTGQTTAHSASITLSATSAIVYNSSTHTYSAGATAEAGGATRAYDATPAESGTEAYDAGRAAIGISGSWNGATYTATTVGKVTESTATTTLTAHDVYQATNGRYIYPRGTAVQVDKFAPVDVDVIGTSHRVPLTVSGPNTIVDEDGYVWRNMYYCSNWQTLYEKTTAQYYEGNGTATYYPGAARVYVYDRGSKETYYSIPS